MYTFVLLLNISIRVAMMKPVNVMVTGIQKLYKFYHDSIYVCITIYLTLRE